MGRAPPLPGSAVAMAAERAAKSTTAVPSTRWRTTRYRHASSALGKTAA